VSIVRGGEMSEPLGLHGRRDTHESASLEPQEKNHPLAIDRQDERAGTIEPLAHDRLRAGDAVRIDERRDGESAVESEVRLVRSVDDVVRSAEANTLTLHARDTSSADRPKRRVSDRRREATVSELGRLRVAVVQLPERQGARAAVA